MGDGKIYIHTSVHMLLFALVCIKDLWKNSSEARHGGFLLEGKLMVEGRLLTIYLFISKVKNPMFLTFKLL